MLRFSSFLILHEENQAKAHQTEHETRKAFQQHLDKVKSETGKDHVEIMHNGKIHHISHIENAGEGFKGRDPKADFKLVDIHGDHIYLSHKKYDESKGGAPEKHYVSLGGTTNMSNDHPLIKKLVGHVKQYFGGSMLKKGSVHVTLDPEKDKSHEHIVKQAMFGAGHGQKDHHENNIHSIVHGNMSLVKNKEGFHTISAPHILHHDEPVKGKFAIFARGGTKRSNHGLVDTRTQIGALGSRKSKEINDQI